MYTYKIGISEEEHDQFVLSHPLATLLQSSQWAKVKDNWKHELLGFYRDGSLVATAACLIRPLPLGFSMIYVPRGPILDYSDFDLLRFVISSLKAFGKTKKALSIKLDPSLLIKSAHIDQDSDENGQTLSTIAFLKSLGLDWSGRTQHLEETIQPRFQANIFACDFSLDQLSKKAKQSIRTATNKGVEISFGQTELLEEFAQLMKKTENRKGIILRGIDYYRKLLDTYQDQSFITMARLNLEEQEKTVRNQLEKALELQQQFTEKSKPSKVSENQKTIERLQKEIHFLQEEMTKGKKLVPLAATLTLQFGNTSENLYAGMDDTYRQYQAALFTWYHTAQEAFNRGCQNHNLGGIENHLDGGLYQFKSRLNPTIEEFAGEFNIPVSPLHKPAMLAYKLRKAIRSKH